MLIKSVKTNVKNESVGDGNNFQVAETYKGAEMILYFICCILRVNRSVFTDK